MREVRGSNRYSSFVTFSVLALAVCLGAPAVAAAPSITSMSPLEAPRSGRLVISGTGFGLSQSGGSVLIGGLEAIATTWTDLEIHAYVPEAAGPGVVQVQVVTAQGTSNAHPLTVTMRAADGRVQWTFEMDSPYTGAWTAVAPGGTVYATDDTRMYALAPDGALLWVLEGGGGGRPIVLEDDGTIFSALGRIVQAIDPAGNLIWQFDPGDSTSLVAGPGLGPDGHLYAAQDLGLGAFSLTTAGELRWDDPGDPAIISFSGGNWRTLFGEDRVYFPVKINASAAPALWVFDAGGIQRWYSGDIPENFGSAARLDPFGRVIVIWGQVGMMAVSSEGAVVWIATPPSSIGTLVRPAVGPDGAIYTASYFGSDFWAIYPDGSTKFLIEDGPYDQLGKLDVTPDGSVVLGGNQAGFGLGGAISGYDPASGALLFQISLTDEQGLSQSVWSQEPSFSPDGGTAYVTTRFAGDAPPGFLYAVAIGVAAENDADLDGIADGIDNCPQDYNPDQADCDLDGTGDACETDSFDDCNANGINDTCDVNGGASADENLNGHPDECEALEPDDLTVNTIQDVVDFGGGQGANDLPGPDGLISFREALLAAANTPGPQRVAFNIPRAGWADPEDTGPELRQENGIFRISGDQDTVDFLTQTAFTGDTNPLGNEVAIYGFEPNAWGVTSLLVEADDCNVKGLGRVLQRGYGVTIEGDRNSVTASTVTGPFYAGVHVRGAGGNPASDNRIGGTEPGEGNAISSGGDGVLVTGPATGNVIVGNHLTGVGSGVTIGGSDAIGNRIGGPTPVERNVIAGAGSVSSHGCPSGRQLAIGGAMGTLVEGNYIGTSSDGLAEDGGSATIGVLLFDAVDTTLRDNVISGIDVTGIQDCSGQQWGDALAIEGMSSGNTVVGNLIGTSADGTSAIGSLNGIVVRMYQGAFPTTTVIGGTAAGDGNVVAHAVGTGITVGDGVDGVIISGNSIFDNGQLGIELNGSANGGQATPTITEAATDDVSLHVSGTVVAPPLRPVSVELFADAACDPSGTGEGRDFLGSTSVVTDDAGLASFDTTLPFWIPAGNVVTATATDLVAGQTSAFSACAVIAQTVCTDSPPQVTGVMFDADQATLRWTAFGPTVEYDVARADLGPSEAGPWVCLVSGQQVPEASDVATPAPGAGFAYIVRATSGCGSGPWGSSSSGVARAASCP